MRPFTNNEYKRMQIQAEARCASKSQIAFRCAYVDNVNGPTTAVTWLETGYIADFRFSGFGEEATRGALVPITINTMAATCFLPMRYYENSRFITRQAPDYRANGKPFDLKILHSGSNFMTDGVVSCDAIVLQNVNGIAPEFFTENFWNLITEPIILADGVLLSLQTTETLSVRSWMEANNIPLPRYAGYDANGDRVVFGPF